MYDRDAIWTVASAALEQCLATGTRSFAALSQAEVGTPALVRSPMGDPVHWLVPLVIKDLACGFVQVDLSGRVTRIGTYGAGPKDHASWFPASFFYAPPPNMLTEVEQRFNTLELTDPILSYEGSPDRMAWRMEVSRVLSTKTVIYLTPGGWYVKT